MKRMFNTGFRLFVAKVDIVLNWRLGQLRTPFHKKADCRLIGPSFFHSAPTSLAAAAQPAKYRLSLLALFSLLLSACTGGNDLPPPPPPALVAVWQAPQIAPVSSTSILLVQADGADGVFVVGATNNDGLVVQRFSASAGWFGQTVELRGLRNLQAVALDDGVALLGRDDTSWYRRDYTVSGLKPLQTMFPVDFRNSARTDAIVEVFSRTHDGAILATALVQDIEPPLRTRIQTREYRGGAWSAVRQSPVLLPGGSEFSIPLPLAAVDVVRSKAGDVARVRYQTISTSSYVAFRAPSDAAFAAITPSICVHSTCLNRFGSYGPPVLELDGTATVPASRLELETDEWLAIRSNVPAQLWPTGIVTKLTTLSPIARLLRSNGTPIWLTDSTGALMLWEGAARVAWAADAAALARCMFRVCAAISSPDADHVASLQSPTPGAATLYMIDRGDDGRWAQSAAVASALLQSGALAGARLHIAGFYSKGSTQVVVGFADTNVTAGPPLAWPFAFVKR